MTGTTTYEYEELEGLMSLMTGDEKHSAAATSTLDVLWVLYDSVLNVSPEQIEDAARDRFILSKGHGPMAYYAVLAAKGFFPVALLESWAGPDSALGMHPDAVLIPGVEIASGSLGHGLPIAMGIALALDAKKGSARVFCLVGDGELNEGSNAEAIEAAPQLNVGRLTVVVVDNKSSTLPWHGGIASRFAIAGWATTDVDGRDHRALAKALGQPHDKPLAIVAHVEPRSR